MTDTMRPSSYLPKIRCSDCNAEIEISMMGNHVCSSISQATGHANPPSRPSNHAQPNHHKSISSSFLRPSRVPPPRIDLSAANRPFLRHDQLSPALSPISRSASPGTPSSARNTRFAMPGRSATSPLPQLMGPPSPELTNLDCAFPPFPTSRSRSTTPTDLKRSRSSRPDLVVRTEPPPPSPSINSLPPRSIGGDSVLQRMNTIVPGPFGVGEHKRSLPTSTPDSAGKSASNGLDRTATSTDVVYSVAAVNSKSCNEECIVIESGRKIDQMPQAGPLSSTLSADEEPRKLHLGPPPPRPPRPDEPLDLGRQAALEEGSIITKPWPIQLPAQMPLLNNNDAAGNSPSLTSTSSSNAAPSRPPRPDNLFDFGTQSSVQEAPEQDPLRSENRSKTFPLMDESSGMGKGPSWSLPRRPSEPNPIPRPRRPTIMTTSRPPLVSALSASPSVMTHSLLDMRPSPLTGRGATNSQLSQDSPRDAQSNNVKAETQSAPVSASTGKSAAGNRYHTPTESSSSNGSGYGSDGKTGSSRSSPPTSEASVGNERKPPNDSKIDNLMDDIKTSIEKMSPKKSTPSPLQPRNKPPSFSRPLFTRPLAPPKLEPASEDPESPMDPAIQDGLIVTRASLMRAHTTGSPVPAGTENQPPICRPTTSRKGNCRGCGEAIVGKSVSSADGRLTGRYHKPCFVCKTCKEPFQTADFYVISNHPYCERHYHQLNNTVCHTCNRGIEGQYLETERKQKFHPPCFTCQDCRKVLGADYYELNGKVYCEQHASRAAQQTTFLGPGRKHPERRTTKLMFMEGAL